MGTKFQFEKVKKFWRWDIVTVAQQCKGHRTVHLKVVNFMLYVFYRKEKKCSSLSLKNILSAQWYVDMEKQGNKCLKFRKQGSGQAPSCHCWDICPSQRRTGFSSSCTVNRCDQGPGGASCHCASPWGWTWVCVNTEPTALVGSIDRRPAPILRTATPPERPGTGEDMKLRVEVPFEQSLEKSNLRRSIIPGG